jgi:hypothetical protein
MIWPTLEEMTLAGSLEIATHPRRKIPYSMTGAPPEFRDKNPDP